MIPLRDRNPTELTPLVTFLIIAANVAVWLSIQEAGVGRGFLASLCTFGAIPADIMGELPEGRVIPLGPEAECRAGGLGWLSILTSMFLHGSWIHLIGNMWFLWVFGDNIEDSMGHLRFVLFYLLTGVVAALAHILTEPASLVPTVGASGAISGVMGAYLILYPRVRVDTLFVFVFIIRVFPLPAWLLLVEWLAIQVFSGISAYGAEGGGVAFWAHVGGFVAGVVLIKIFERRGPAGARRRR